MVPVDAENLNRIMRLASESMIESRRLQRVNQSLESLRSVFRKTSDLLTVAAASGAGWSWGVARSESTGRAIA